EEDDVARPPEAVAPTDQVVIRDSVNASTDADRQALLGQQAVAQAEASRIHVGHRHVHRGARCCRRSHDVGLIAWTHEVRAREISERSRGHLPNGLPLQDEAPAAVPEFAVLSYGKLD